MKYISLILFLLLSSFCIGQTTTVNATVQYPDGNTFAFGTVQAVFTPISGNIQKELYKVNGSTFTYYVSGVMDGTGTFSLALTDDHLVRPLGGRWMITVCSIATSPCSSSLQDVFGTTINLSTLINASVRNPSVYGSNVPSLYADTEVVPNPTGGTSYFNLVSKTFRCYNGTVWAACGGGGGSTNPAGNNLDVQFNSSGSFGGNDFYQINVPLTPPGGNYAGTNPSAFIIGPSAQSTAGSNQASNLLVLQSSYFNGSALNDNWIIYNGLRPPNNSNPRAYLVFNHTGASGSSSGSNYNIIFSGDNTLDSGSSCEHDDPSFTVNSTHCVLAGSINTSGSGSDLELRNTATTGSMKTRLIQRGTGASSFDNFLETDPNNTYSKEYGMAISYGSANYYPYFFVNGATANLPILFLGGYAYSGASKAAMEIQVDNTQGVSVVRKQVIFHGLMTLVPTTVANLGTCNGGTESSFGWVTDSTTVVWGAAASGGGANHAGLTCDGTNWTVFAK